MTTVAGAAPNTPPIEQPGAMASERSASVLRWMRYSDPAALLGWAVSTTMPFSWSSPLRYLVAAYFCVGLALYLRQTLPVITRSWPVFIIPVLCIISAIWAPSSSEAIRKGVMFALTGLVAIYAAARLSARQILAVYMLAELFGALLSLRYPNVSGGAWTGIFGQKNFLAAHMFILFAAAFPIALDRGSNRWIRLTAAGCIPLAAMLIVLAKSGTTTLLLLGAGGAFLVHAFLWEPAQRIRHMRTLIVIFGALIVAIVSLVLFGIMQFDVEETVLKALGKDSTLTGRTYLWETAERVMAEHPLTGVGADGFWRSDLGLANAITRYFDYETYVRFSFHNSYLENGVAFGYPGYWATIFVAGWALVSTTLNWVRNQSMLNVAFLVLAAMILVRSTAEIDLAQEFTGTAVLLFIGAARKEFLPRRQPAAQQYPPLGQYGR